MLDIEALAASVAIVVREAVASAVPAAVDAATAPLCARIKELEDREAEPGEPGKDADPSVIRTMVDEAVAAIKIPTPKDGVSADPDQVRQMVADAVAAVPPAEPGKDADPTVVKQMVAEAVAEIELPTPRDGVDADMDTVRAWITDAVGALPVPADGKSVTVADVEPMIEQAVAKAVAKLPDPVNGKDVDPEAMKAAVAEAVASLPAPADGKSITVADVAPLIADEVSKAVANLPAAKDGVGLAGALIDRTGTLVMTLTDGKMCELGRVEGKDGDPGLGFDDLTFEHDGERGVVLRFIRGERIKEFSFMVPVVLDRGVFKEGAAYEHGDAVTFGGSLWIAQKDTTAKPDGADTGWRLAVKRGRDGRDLTKE